MSVGARWGSAPARPAALPAGDGWRRGRLRLPQLPLGAQLLDLIEVEGHLAEHLWAVLERLGVGAVGGGRRLVGVVLALQRLVGRVARERTHPGEVDAELL